MEALEVIAVLHALDVAGIRAGITGGWGIDALLRRQTRPHRDLDLGVPAESVDAAIEALGEIGYALVLDERPARLELHGARGQVDLHPIAWDDAGHGVQTGFDGRVFEYPPGSLDAVGEISNLAVRCGTPELQWAFHQGYTPGEHDLRDMAALAAAFPHAIRLADEAGERTSSEGI
jgi:lincosamide nucleotidyltransferase A/C/D/E